MTTVTRAVAVGAALILSGSGAVDSPAARVGSRVVAFEGVSWSNTLQTARGRIYSIQEDGRGLRPLTRAGPWMDTSPAWSRDGTRLAFARLERNDWRLYVADANGRRLHALTTPQPLADEPSWSPDGRFIAFAHLPKAVPGRKVFAQQISVVSVATRRVHQVTGFSAFPAGAGHPAWSPDGKLVLFESPRTIGDNVPYDVWVARADGSGARMLLRNGKEPAWSPDGRTIAFVRGSDVYVASAAGRSLRRLTSTPRSSERQPSFSPDGGLIAISIVHRYRNQARDDARIGLLNLDDRRTREITDRDPLFWAMAPAWRPNRGL